MIRESRIKIHRSSALEKNTHYNSSVWNVFKLRAWDSHLPSYLFISLEVVLTYPILVNRLSKSFNSMLA